MLRPVDGSQKNEISEWVTLKSRNTTTTSITFILCHTLFYKLSGNSKQVPVKKPKTYISALVATKGKICVVLDSDPLEEK